MSTPRPHRKPSTSAGAAYSPRRAGRPQASAADGKRSRKPDTPLRQWIKQRLSEHPGKSGISLAFTLGGLLMLIYFNKIQYLPSVDLKSVTGILLGTAMAGLLTLGSTALLLLIPGAALQYCVRYKIINPGTGSLDENLKSPARSSLKGNARAVFLLHVYVAEALALAAIIGPLYLGLTQTVFGWPLFLTVWLISLLFLIGVGWLTFRHKNGGPARQLPRVRFKRIGVHTHGLWILGFLTLLLIAVNTFPLLIFPFFQQEDDLVSLLYFGLVISISCAFGFAIRHNWKSALISNIFLVLAFLFVLGGIQPLSAAVMRTLKLGALENVEILVSPAGCQSVSTMLEAGLCQKPPAPPSGVCRIRGLTILSRIGEEHLLAFKTDQSESRLTLRSSEVMNIVFAEKSRKQDSEATTKKSTCIAIESIPAQNSPKT